MNIDDLLLKVRRKIQDNTKPYQFGDDELTDLIQDAIDSLMSVYPIEYDIELTPEGELSREINGLEANCIAVQSMILRKKLAKYTSDEENFKMTKGQLSLDNTNQSKDHLESIMNLERELDKILRTVYVRWKSETYSNTKGTKALKNMSDL